MYLSYRQTSSGNDEIAQPGLDRHLCCPVFTLSTLFVWLQEYLRILKASWISQSKTHKLKWVLFLILDYGFCFLCLFATLLIITFPTFFCLLYTQYWKNYYGFFVFPLQNVFFIHKVNKTNKTTSKMLGH